MYINYICGYSFKALQKTVKRTKKLYTCEMLRGYKCVMHDKCFYCQETKFILFVAFFESSSRAAYISQANFLNTPFQEFSHVRSAMCLEAKLVDVCRLTCACVCVCTRVYVRARACVCCVLDKHKFSIFLWGF